MVWGRSKKTEKKADARAAGSVGRRMKVYSRERLSPAGFEKWERGSKSVPMAITQGGMVDRAAGYKALFGLMARYYPLAAAGVWTWKNLCATKQTVKFVGGEDKEREEARRITNALDRRISPFSCVQGGGMDMLIEQFFHYLFTYGRFAGNLELERDLSAVEGFKIYDPFRVRFDKERKPYFSENGVDYYSCNRKTFFYYALSMDWENPYGSAMLEAAQKFMQMAHGMITDLVKASANAGVPRLHIKIEKPDMMPGEDSLEYVNRANEYFDAYVSQFADIGPDDNIYSWNDLSVGAVGGHPGASGFVWRTNTQIVDEEIMAAYHLFAWLIGRSTQTTKNWVRSQYDLIMAQAESLQRIGKRFAEWIRNTELALKGILEVKAHMKFEAPRDPARKDNAIAERFEINNVENKVNDGFISPDDGARELGYDKSFDSSLLPRKTDRETKPEHREDRTDEVLEGIERVEELVGGLTHKESQ